MVAAAEPVASTAVFESLAVASWDDDNDVSAAAAGVPVVLFPSAKFLGDLVEAVFETSLETLHHSLKCRFYSLYILMMVTKSNAFKLSSNKNP